MHFVNTGSVGRPKDGDPRADYCALALDGKTVITEQIRLSCPMGVAGKRLVKAGLPEYFAEYLRTGGTAPTPVFS